MQSQHSDHGSRAYELEEAEYNPTEPAFVRDIPCGGGSPHDGPGFPNLYEVDEPDYHPTAPTNLLTTPQYSPNCVPHGGAFCVSDNQVSFAEGPGEGYTLRDENKDHKTMKDLQEILDLKLRLEVDWLHHKGVPTGEHAERDVVTIRRAVRDMPQAQDRLDALDKIQTLARKINVEFKYEEELSRQKKLLAVRPFLLKNDEHFRLYIGKRFDEFIDFSADCWLH